MLGDKIGYLPCRHQLRVEQHSQRRSCMMAALSSHHGELLLRQVVFGVEQPK
ncbi:hypothetical protein VRK_04670 [Vibrio sp. MEBiC08052]|nr:hypothetical protein VRK_04670 [Vibrio sp. MEBiC08052]